MSKVNLLKDDAKSRSPSIGSTSKMMKMLGVSQEDLNAKAKRRQSLPGGPDDEAEEAQFKRNLELPANYIFAAKDSTENIQFMALEDSTDLNPLIKAATLPKLVERLTYSEYVDPSYVFVFLLTYRSFASSKEFLDLLIERFNMPTPDYIVEEESALKIFQNSILKPIRLRVFNVLKKWIEEHWYDFEDNKDLIDAAKTFVEGTMMQHMETAAKTLTQVITKKIEGKGITLIASTATCPPPIVPDPKAATGLPPFMAFMTFHQTEIARQLTLLEFELFKSIKPWECLGQGWTKKDKEIKAPNLVGMISRFNQVSMWVSGSIVYNDNPKTRADVMVKFIDIADELRKLHNFNGAMEVLAGLQTAAATRLKKTWALVNKDKMKLFDELVEFLSPVGNYTTLRSHLKSVIPPCIPYIGVYLTDLTFLEDGNQDILYGLINFDKRRRIATVINDIKHYQQTRYDLENQPAVREFITKAGEEYLYKFLQYLHSRYNENMCYKESLKVEPRESNTN